MPCIAKEPEDWICFLVAVCEHGTDNIDWAKVAEGSGALCGMPDEPDHNIRFLLAVCEHGINKIKWDRFARASGLYASGNSAHNAYRKLKKRYAPEAENPDAESGTINSNENNDDDDDDEEDLAAAIEVDALARAAMRAENAIKTEYIHPAIPDARLVLGVRHRW